MTHRAYRNLGRTLLTEEERQSSVPWYAGAHWLARKAIIAARVKRQQDAAHERAIARKTVVPTSVLTRAKQRIQAALQRRQDTKRRRAAAYALSLQKANPQNICSK
jgi:hypothetical protein